MTEWGDRWENRPGEPLSSHASAPYALVALAAESDYDGMGQLIDELSRDQLVRAIVDLADAAAMDGAYARAFSDDALPAALREVADEYRASIRIALLMAGGAS